ncbi:hypothetical protein NC652_024399 [Populus alba x Populus x berolinensis]|nr:hypothetical protein NC652_024399 [Populus alba x Populus x berolinensis]
MAAFTWGLLLVVSGEDAFVILKDFLLWVEQDLGPWGPLVLAVAYIPLTVLVCSKQQSGLLLGDLSLFSKVEGLSERFRSVAIAIQKFWLQDCSAATTCSFTMPF